MGFGITSKSANKNEAEKLLMYLTSTDVDKAVGNYAGSPVRYPQARRDKNPWYDSHLAMLEQTPSVTCAGAIMASL